VPGAWRTAAAGANPWQAGDDGRQEVTDEDAGGVGRPSWWSEQRVAHHGRLPAVVHVSQKQTPMRWGRSSGGQSLSGR
jgi:hypothetical protein